MCLEQISFTQKPNINTVYWPSTVAALRVCWPRCEKNIWARPQNDDICREVRGDSPPENI